MDQKKMIKMEKDVVSSGRLQSLKLPRDLSLGLSKPKKQYQPNLNVSRNKDKTKEFLKKMDQKRKDRPMRNSDHQRNKNDKNDSKRFVQSDGVFSHGAGDTTRRPNLITDRRSYQRDTNSTSNLTKPSINRNSWQTNDVKNDDFLLDELNNYQNDSDDDIDDKSAFHALKLTTIKMKQLKTDIKTETDTDCSRNQLSDNERIPEPFNSDKYDDEQPAICLLKLPDSFAGKGLSDDPKCKKLFDYPLDNMLEGQIGKLLLHKSGRMEIQIGKMRYHLEQEILNEATEELATIIQNDNGEISLALLGNITHDFVMFPDYQQF